MKLTITNLLDRLLGRSKPDQATRQLQHHREVAIGNVTAQDAYSHIRSIPNPPLDSEDRPLDNEDPPPYTELPPESFEPSFRLCEHEVLTTTELHRLGEAFGDFLFRCYRHNWIEEGVLPPYIYMEPATGHIIATSMFHLLEAEPSIQPSFQDVQNALIDIDKMVCAHLRTSNVAVIFSIARKCHIPLSWLRLDNDVRPRWVSKYPATWMKKHIGRCEEQGCNTRFMLDWSDDAQETRLKVNRVVGKMQS